MIAQVGFFSLAHVICASHRAGIHGDTWWYMCDLLCSFFFMPIKREPDRRSIIFLVVWLLRRGHFERENLEAALET